MCFRGRPGHLGRLALALLFVAATPLSAQTDPLLADGDRVVLLGGTFIERMQTHGYLEAQLASQLHARNLTFRNLGWSGDNVQGESRAVFGAITDGYSRLLRDMKLASPSVVVVHYGVVEAGGGPAGVAGFHSGLSRLVKDIQEMDSRVILLAPRPLLEMGDPFPSPDLLNQTLGLCRSAIMEVGSSHGAAVIDLDQPGLTRLSPAPLKQSMERTGRRRSPFMTGLTLDGLQLTASGYWQQAALLSTALGGNREKLVVTLQVPRNRITATGGTASITSSGSDRVEIAYRRQTLPGPSFPGEASQSSTSDSRLTLRIDGLPPGKYQVSGDVVIPGDALFTSRRLASGIDLPAGDTARVLELLDTIAKKNEYFFHRYRPQNETYLFLFRKHEQGNNAVEVPMFDPLVESLDRDIHRLSVPPTHRLVIRRRGSP